MGELDELLEPDDKPDSPVCELGDAPVRPAYGPYTMANIVVQPGDPSWLATILDLPPEQLARRWGAVDTSTS